MLPAESATKIGLKRPARNGADVGRPRDNPKPRSHLRQTGRARRPNLIPPHASRTVPVLLNR